LTRTLPFFLLLLRDIEKLTGKLQIAITNCSINFLLVNKLERI
jgi:hypothetical protein